jgi:hypothetical protein
MIYYRKTLFGSGPKLTAVQRLTLAFYSKAMKPLTQHLFILYI